MENIEENILKIKTDVVELDYTEEKASKGVKTSYCKKTREKTLRFDDAR